MNTAEILQFPPPTGGKEQKVADTDDGYTRIANELLEAIAGADLTARQLKVMIAVIRKTYGFQKKLDRIADIQIAELTGLSRQNVNKAKKELLSMHCLMMDGNRIGPNKELSAWHFTNSLQKRDSVSKLKTQSVSKIETHEVSKLETHKRNTLKIKENSNTPLIPQRGKVKGFDPLSVEIPEWLSKQSWIEWVSYRSQSKKPIKSMLTVTKAFNLLKECFDEGHDPSAVIDASIANSYQGLFKPKYPIIQQTQVVNNQAHWNDKEAWENEFI
ncbi:replication protein [Yersinia enterocolitica]|uniref:DNA-binding phage protein n=1 Tax=Yersinia mollaretii TaxID=33060 RepID=A0AA36LTL3_YERMO|nr:MULTISPECIES: replication protein [Yersinia]EKN3753884.1 replication protein [Yersinia enterocolitica]EKN3794792.1 replication protein [Yersinia enterocolitica]EKN3875993.1 replication protein [Yersinia enterocolitica]EKN4173521.1 replication protein [Yersinia enterocolitica]ELY5227072.1 replication protein [Yersinia enterocolitica]